MKSFLRILIVVVSSILLLGLVLGVVLYTTSFKPTQQMSIDYIDGSRKLYEGETLVLISWNIGSAINGLTTDSFKEGGKTVEPISIATVRENLLGIADTLNFYQADAYLLQEVDQKSKRSGNINQVSYFKDHLMLGEVFALDHKTSYYPYPWPPQGRIASGLAVYSEFSLNNAHRVALPSASDSFPYDLVDPKRGMIAMRVPIDRSSRTLVLINTNLDRDTIGTDDEQFKALIDFAKSEFDKGNYVVVGGTWNRKFPGDESFTPPVEGVWEPAEMNANLLPDGWTLAYDNETPTVRTLNKPYSNNDVELSTYVVDGYLCSPNIRVETVETINEEFFYSPHNPVHITFTILPEGY